MYREGEGGTTQYVAISYRLAVLELIQKLYISFFKQYVALQES